MAPDQREQTSNIIMRITRWLIFGVVVLLLLFGAALAFDRRFVPLSDVIYNPLFVALIYAPTAIFSTISLIQLRRGRTWPAIAFTAGLIGTGSFHQSVIDISYGNPGYMIPSGHLGAPVVSVIAYSVSFLVIWCIVRVGNSERIPRMIKKIRDTLAI